MPPNSSIGSLREIGLHVSSSALCCAALVAFHFIGSDCKTFLFQWQQIPNFVQVLVLDCEMLLSQFGLVFTSSPLIDLSWCQGCGSDGYISRRLDTIPLGTCSCKFLELPGFGGRKGDFQGIGFLEVLVWFLLWLGVLGHVGYHRQPANEFLSIMFFFFCFALCWCLSPSEGKRLVLWQ